MIKRGLDGTYFRVKREEKYDNVCFSDLTLEEMDNVLEGRNIAWIIALIGILTNTFENIITQFSDIEDFCITEDLTTLRILNNKISNEMFVEELKNVAKRLGVILYAVGEKYGITTKMEDEEE